MCFPDNLRLRTFPLTIKRYCTTVTAPNKIQLLFKQHFQSRPQKHNRNLQSWDHKNHVPDSYYPKLLTLAIIKTFSGGHWQKLMHLLPTVGNQHWDKVCQKSPEWTLERHPPLYSGAWPSSTATTNRDEVKYI